jgi:hypothetical protein
MGETLLVRYVEADQEPDVAEQNRENERRRKQREEYAAAFKAANPDKPFKPTKEQSAECKWSPEGLRVKLRLETVGVDCDLHEALALSNLRDGDRLVLYTRWAVDERLPVDQRKEFTPTPKQMLYGNRAELTGIVATEKDGEGRIRAGYAEVELKESFGGEWSRGFVFPAINRPLEDGKLYTLDPCPNDWYGYWCSQVVEGLCAGQPNTLYDRLVHPSLAGDGGGSPGQLKFLAGLDAFHQAGHLHDFEVGKRSFIGGHGSTPVLLVQGPPRAAVGDCPGGPELLRVRPGRLPGVVPGVRGGPLRAGRRHLRQFRRWRLDRREYRPVTQWHARSRNRSPPSRAAGVSSRWTNGTRKRKVWRSSSAGPSSWESSRSG